MQIPKISSIMVMEPPSTKQCPACPECPKCPSTESDNARNSLFNIVLIVLVLYSDQRIQKMPEMKVVNKYVNKSIAKRLPKAIGQHLHKCIIIFIAVYSYTSSISLSSLTALCILSLSLLIKTNLFSEK